MHEINNVCTGVYKVLQLCQPATYLTKHPVSSGECSPSDLCSYQCNVWLPQVQAEGGGWSGLVGKLMAKFAQSGGDL